MKIVLIDGEKIILELASMILKSRGHEVSCVDNFEEGKELLVTKRPDVVISEYLIKEETCLSFVQYLKKLKNIPGLIILTGKGSEEIAASIIRSGADEYLLKPFNNQKLIEYVERVYTKKLLNDEIKELRNELNYKAKNHIVRSIEFDPEHYQAGLSILSYFNTIVNQKYPDLKVKVKIEQEAMTVRMVIESPDGSKDKVEKTLEEFGLVVKGELPPEALLKNKLEVMALKNKLELSSLELRQARDLHRICESKNSERINSLELQVLHLNHLVAEGLKGVNKNADLLYGVLDKTFLNFEIKNQIENILIKVDKGLTASDEKEVKLILNQIKEENPDILEKLKDFAINTISGVSGNFLYSWILSILKNL